MSTEALTYRAAIQELIRQTWELYDRAGGYRDCAMADEKDFWNQYRGLVYDANHSLIRLDNGMSHDIAIRPLSESTLPVTADFMTWFVILSQLQLALRHPGNCGPSADIAMGFAQRIQSEIEQYFPDTAAVIAAGWNPDFDV